MDFIKQIQKYEPVDEQEVNDKRVILEFIKNNDNVLLRENEIAHITSSGFILNKTFDKVLMVHHNIYNSWCWTGGHADGDCDLLKVAIKEAIEETGVKNVYPLSQDIASIDILGVNSHIKRGKYVSSHLHLSIAYLLVCDEEEKLEINEEENSGVKWIDIDKMLDVINEEHMVYLYEKLIKKSKNIMTNK